MARVIQHEYINSQAEELGHPSVYHEMVLQVDTDEVGTARRKIAAHSNRRHLKCKLLLWPRRITSSGNGSARQFISDLQLRVFRRGHGSLRGKKYTRISRARKSKSRSSVLHYGMTSISKQLSNLDRTHSWPRRCANVASTSLVSVLFGSR